MSLAQAFAALFSAIEILASMDADLSHRLCVVHRRCLQPLDTTAVEPEATRARIETLRETLARHDPEGAAGAIATRGSQLEGLDSPAMEDLAREIVALYMDLLLGGRRNGSGA
ncbi:hypothetical protein [Roseospira visakhapatnamensis]|uniref:Uncharacterized protein n=1 Tax=Roseospira visakhapatnamensis TaxID=390880 RepID=A0A7W6RF62_9PROT|nr:hypothetical protein [Roseospira visakhapatnamensis]MBB4267416.1 hypothetical protein [Roseospira visakhapatnamensis]